MIDVHEVLIIHETLIREFGGVSGVRDNALLISALERPYAGLSDTEFYPTIYEKAGALIESIV